MLPQIAIFGKFISVYGLIAIVGAFISGVVFCRMIKRRGLDDNDAIVFMLLVALGVLVGGHLLYGLLHIRLFPLLLEKAEIGVWLQRLNAVFGGSVFYGGLIGGLLTGRLAIAVMHLDYKCYSDCMAPIIPLFHGIARIGCFFAGCCYGIESEFGFTAQNNPFIPEVNQVSRFPVQLLEAGCNFVLAIFIFIFLRGVYTSPKKAKWKGKLICIYLICYACIRFSDEFLRGDTARGIIGIFSVSQWISIAICVGCVISLLVPAVQKQKINKKDSTE
ncbi:MAG TPA: prolipoprotein diacylglyceryl transferase [Firmicutes bacterium]|nr:prolipoprotein diacylglyceryl transferase [Bacillota bacterium]